MGDPAACGQLVDLGLVERRLCGEVEAVELAHGGKVGDLGRHLDPPLVLAGDLALDQEGERLAQGHLARAASSSRVSSPSRRGQLESRQPGDERVVVDRHRQPPPTSRSYSARGRRSSGGFG
jgi:hypothetical protein